jgi:hypothetical protein
MSTLDRSEVERLARALAAILAKWWIRQTQMEAPNTSAPDKPRVGRGTT